MTTMAKGFPPDCKLTPELKEKVLASIPSRRRYASCKWCNILSVTKAYRDACARAQTVTQGY